MFAAQSEISGNAVTVTKKSGETQLVTAAKISKPFKGKFGAYTGMDCVFIMPKKEVSRQRERVQRCYAGHTTPVDGCRDCFDEFDV